jgi:hypothetical protein
MGTKQQGLTSGAGIDMANVIDFARSVQSRKNLAALAEHPPSVIEAAASIEEDLKRIASISRNVESSELHEWFLPHLELMEFRLLLVSMDISIGTFNTGSDEGAIADPMAGRASERSSIQGRPRRQMSSQPVS